MPLRRPSRRRSSASVDIDDDLATNNQDGDPTLTSSSPSLHVSSIERLGCHIPLCVARTLEDNPLSYLGSEEEAQRGQLGDANAASGGGGGNGEHSQRQFRGGRRSSMGRRLSWSNQSRSVQTLRGSVGAATSATTRMAASTVSTDVSTISDESSVGAGSGLSGGRNFLESASHYPLPLPHGNTYRYTALLFVDISGFTRLATLLDVESLSKAINTYFELLLRQVDAFGGDVLKFAGDSFYAAWAEEDAENVEDLDDAVRRAALCGSSIVGKYSGYKVPGISALAHSSQQQSSSSQSPQSLEGRGACAAVLDVHAGVGVGQLATLHVGNNTSRNEVLFLGDPINQVSHAEASAKHGQLAASSEAVALLRRTCEVTTPDKDDEADDDDSVCSADGSSQVIACHNVRFFQPREDHLSAGLQAEQQDDEEHEPQPYRLTYLSPNIMGPLRRQISLYVHPAARRDDPPPTRGGGGGGAGTVGGDTHDAAAHPAHAAHEGSFIADAEIRSVYTIFVQPQLDPHITGHKAADMCLFSLLNDIMGSTLRVLDRFRGHLRQFIVDDKGVVLIATFGQRGASHPNMVTEKGLPATMAIYDALKIDLDIDSRVGATFGKAYCGVVGGLRRHEFSVLGPSVNLAARLMCSDDNPGILVDDAVRQVASKRFDFLSHPPVVAKGYDEPVPIFEPMAAIERQWTRVQGDKFVGREDELTKLRDIGRRWLLKERGRDDAQMVLIQAHSGLGKSCLAMQAMEMIRRLGGSYKVQVTIKKNVCEDGDQRVPFCVFRRILLDLLMERADDNDAATTATNSDDWNDSDSSLSMDGLESCSTHGNDALYLDRLRALCAHLNYSDEFADLLGGNMLGLRPGRKGGVDETKRKNLPPHDVVDFVADAFLECTSQASGFVLLALDDIQWMDSLSWNVVQCMVERGKNLMIMCMSRPLATSNISIGPEFLKALDSCDGNGPSRFAEIQLLPFSRSDIQKLLAFALECDAESIDDEVCDYLYEQSGYFAQEIVSNMMRNELLEWRQDGSIGWQSGLTDAGILYLNVNELLLHRLDNFKSDGRTLLQVCAVLGFEFSLSELLMVHCRGRIKKKQVEKLLDVLKKADKDRILVEICQGGSAKTKKIADSSQISNCTGEHIIAERHFVFSHAIWRKCLLGTMLEERKRDLHRAVATILEGKGFDRVEELRNAMKLFGHWKASGDFRKASELARMIGKHLDALLLRRQSIELCLEAIEMWKAKDQVPGDEEDAKVVAGISLDLLNSITPDELECLARLHIAVAKSFSSMKEFEDAKVFYERCDTILTKASVASKLKDRTVFFALYSGLFVLLKGGVISDDKHALQQELATRFVEQAQLHGDPIHIARALAMQGLTLAGLGNYEGAIAAQKRLEGIYSAEELSAGICREYASDRAAQAIGCSILWYEVLGRHEESQNQIDYILQEIMPRMPERNVHNSIMILFPVMWVLIENGQARKAEAVFVKHVYDRFYEFYGKDSTTFFSFLYKPLQLLFRLAGGAQGEGVMCKEEYKDMEDWVLSEEVGVFGDVVALDMNTVGRNPYCIVAEICWFLAVANEDENRGELLGKGFVQAQKSLEYAQGNPGFEYSRRQCEKILMKFTSEMS